LKLGLMTLMDCPRSHEAAVLFHMERLAKVLDRSRLKPEWRALLSLFVGFDSNYGLLMGFDLEWWRIEQGTHDSEWARFPSAIPAVDKPVSVKPAATSAAAKSAAALETRSRKSVPATLFVKWLMSKAAAKKMRGASDNLSFEAKQEAHIVEGILTVGEHELRMADADILGTIALRRPLTFNCSLPTKAACPALAPLVYWNAIDFP
jgi:hypothetical protein